VCNSGGRIGADRSNPTIETVSSRAQIISLLQPLVEGGKVCVQRPAAVCRPLPASARASNTTDRQGPEYNAQPKPGSACSNANDSGCSDIAARQLCAGGTDHLTGSTLVALLRRHMRSSLKRLGLALDGRVLATPAIQLRLGSARSSHCSKAKAVESVPRFHSTGCQWVQIMSQ
jgi:hypothetical protein